MAPPQGRLHQVRLPPGVRAQYPWSGAALVAPDGHALHYLDEGPREAPPLLMVHGNPTWSFYWRNLVKAFAPEYRCVVPDHVGHGLSERPASADYRLQQHIDNLVALIDHLDLERLTLVVHDWGGPIGLGAGVARRERVARLVIFNTSVFLERVPFAIRVLRWSGFGDLAVHRLNAAVEGAIQRSLTHRLPAAVAAGYRAPYRTPAERTGHLAFFRDIPIEEGHPSRPTILGLTESVPRAFAEVPTQFLWGDQDFVFTPRFLARWQELMPHAEAHRLAHAAHWVVEDAHEEIVVKMRDFLQRTAT